jgi:hypothetical protein
MQLRYVAAFLDGKLTAHPWDSVPRGKFARLHPLETPSDVFSNTRCSCLISQTPIAFEIGDRQWRLKRMHGFYLNVALCARIHPWLLLKKRIVPHIIVIIQTYHPR